MKVKSLFILLLISTSGCTVYEAGNVGGIVSFSSNIKSDMIKEMTDSLQREGKLLLPEEYHYLCDFEDHKDLEYKVYYFKSDPKEIYIATFQGVDMIRYVYSFEKEEWLNSKGNIEKKELERIKKRFVNEVLSEIRNKAVSFDYEVNSIYVDVEKCGTVLVCDD